MKKLKAAVVAFLAAAMAVCAVCLSGCTNKNEGIQDAEFADYINASFAGLLQSDYTSMHQFTTDATKYGVDPTETEVTLGGVPTKEAYDQNRLAYAMMNREFAYFNRKFLSGYNRDVYDAVKFDLELGTKMADEKFDFYTQYLGSASGLHYAIATMFTDYVFRAEEDIVALVTLIKDVKRLTDDFMGYATYQHDNGLLLCDYQDTIDYCQGIVDKGTDSAIITELLTLVDDFEGLGLDKKASYKEQINDAFTDYFIPAFEEIIEKVSAWQKEGENDISLYDLPHGKEYYELLLKQKVGADMSVSDITKYLTNKSIYLTTQYAATSKALRDIGIEITQQYPKTGYSDYAKMLQDVNEKMWDDFPAVSKLDYEIHDVNAEVASTGGVAAYFIIPAVDGNEPRQMRVNPNYGEDQGGVGSIDVFTTVCHEGLPGHMYQTQYAYDNLPYNYMKVSNYNNAFTEGYAVYAQYYCGKYLVNYNPKIFDLYKYENLLSYCNVMTLDMKIHTEGMTYEAMVRGLGYTVDMVGDYFMPLYNQLRVNPAIFESYYMGYFQIMDLKQKAQNEVGKNFQDKGFHKALLKSGSVPFSVIERNIKDYIAHYKEYNKDTAPADKEQAA